MDQALDGADCDGEKRRAHLRIRLPRGELRHPEHSGGRPRRRERSRTEGIEIVRETQVITSARREKAVVNEIDVPRRHMLQSRFVSRSLTIAVPLTAMVASSALYGQSAAPKTAPIPVVQPEAAGFSSEALRKLDEGMQGLVDKQHLAGIVTLVARRGQIVQHKAYGMQDANSRAPMKLDTIARIYSMTKPVTGVAMMMLYEEGKWRPSDPIAKHIPEFANLKVYAGENPDGSPRVVPASHQPTMGELMSHTAGFTYGFFGS